MNADQIHINDWQRILTGNMPAVFFIEVVIRLIFIYLLLLAAMRLMGKRMSAMLSRNEMSATVVLAAGIGVPILDPARGVMPSMIIALTVIGVGTMISRRAFKSQKFEKFSQGDISILVSDGIMDVKAMEKARISKDRLMGEVRTNGILHLGKVKRLYLEAGGSFAIDKQEDDAPPGLAVIPDWDTDLIAEQKTTDIIVCKNCGNSKEHNTADRCTNCNEKGWVQAIR